MEDFTTVPCLRLERRLPATLEEVWLSLTDPLRIPKWYGNATFEGKTGGRIEFMDGHVRGTITAWQPPTCLIYSWNVFMPGDTVSPYPESYLQLQLSEGVLLRLQHHPVLPEFEKLNAVGWNVFLDLLQASLPGQPPCYRQERFRHHAERLGVSLPHPG